jgi:hypothetical protein
MRVTISNASRARAAESRLQVQLVPLGRAIVVEQPKGALHHLEGMGDAAREAVAMILGEIAEREADRPPVLQDGDGLRRLVCAH